MATPKQIEANRRNAQKSTGPRTAEGKAAVSLNALKHGLRARRVLLPTENAQEFHQLCADLEAEWQPQSRTEQFYLEQMAVSQWKLNRMETGEVSILTADAGAQTELPLLKTIWQAQARLERAYARAQHDLERLQKSRPHLTAPVGATVAEVGQAVPPVDSAAPGESPSVNAKAPTTSNLLTFPSPSRIIDPPQSCSGEEQSHGESDPM